MYLNCVTDHNFSKLRNKVSQPVNFRHAFLSNGVVLLLLFVCFCFYVLM